MKTPLGRLNWSTDRGTCRPGRKSGCGCSGGRRRTAALRIHRQRMRNFEFARRRAFLAPGLDELAVLGELHDARVGVAAVAVGDKDVAVRRDHDRGRRS